MLKVGLTGGYATGKSFVAAEFERLGCCVIYADRLGHAVLLPQGEAYRATVDTFGSSILETDGTINRRRLGEQVFNAPDRLRLLESFVHPAVFRLEERSWDECANRDPQGIAIYEAAILIETARSDRFDRLILTACEEDVQIARGRERDGLTRDQVRERIARQMPLAEKRKHAHYVIDTGGQKEETLRQVMQLYRALKDLTKALP